MELSTQMAGIVELFLLTFFFGIHFILPHLKLKSKKKKKKKKKGFVQVHDGSAGLF